VKERVRVVVRTQCIVVQALPRVRGPRGRLTHCPPPSPNHSGVHHHPCTRHRCSHLFHVASRRHHTLLCDQVTRHTPLEPSCAESPEHPLPCNQHHQRRSSVDRCEEPEWNSDCHRESSSSNWHPVAPHHQVLYEHHQSHYQQVCVGCSEELDTCTVGAMLGPRTFPHACRARC
jgi:hypothetical protein